MTSECFYEMALVRWTATRTIRAVVSAAFVTFEAQGSKLSANVHSFSDLEMRRRKPLASEIGSGKDAAVDRAETR